MKSKKGKLIDKDGLDKRIKKRNITGKRSFLINKKENDFSNDCAIVISLDDDDDMVSVVGTNRKRYKFDSTSNINNMEI